MAKYQEITLRSGEQIRLTEKEMLFCKYYLADANRNGTAAAKKAGYSEKSATAIAKENLTKPHIGKYIHDQTAPLMEALGITHERILKRLRDQAFTNLGDMVDDDWRLKKPSELTPEQHASLKEMEIEERTIFAAEGESVGVITKTKFKMKDDQKALLELASMAGLRVKEVDPKEQGKVTNIFAQINNLIVEK